MTTNKTPDHCEICEKEAPLTFHHLIPRKCHGNKWFRKNFEKEDMKTRGIYVCHKCHSYIHTIAGEKELGRKYNTLESLLANEKMAKFKSYAVKQAK